MLDSGPGPPTDSEKFSALATPRSAIPAVAELSFVTLIHERQEEGRARIIFSQLGRVYSAFIASTTAFSRQCEAFLGALIDGCGRVVKNCWQVWI